MSLQISGWWQINESFGVFRYGLCFQLICLVFYILTKTYPRILGSILWELKPEWWTFLPLCNCPAAFRVKNGPFLHLSQRSAWAYGKLASGSSCEVNKRKERQPEISQTAGNWALINSPSGSKEMRQELQQFGEQGINLWGLIGGILHASKHWAAHLSWEVKVCEECVG